MIEYAFALNILLLLTLGVIDVSRAIWEYNMAAYVAREGARFGTVQSGSAAAIAAAVQSHVQDRCTSMVGTTCKAPSAEYPSIRVVTDKEVTCDDPSKAETTNQDPKRILVPVTVEFWPAVPFIENVWGTGPIELKSCSQMYF
jgi:Flp pilus assembly protein TadG